MAQVIVNDKSLRVVGSFTIGRVKSCNLAIAHASISREHARIWQEGDDWFIEDLHSANGSSLNGRSLLVGRQRLADGDTVQVGEISLRFYTYDGPVLDLPENAAAPPDVSKLPGTELGGYAILTLERQEVAGPLFRAKHMKTGREVMLWVLDPQVEANEDPDFYQRFIDNLTRAAGLKHPDLIRVYQCGRDNGLIWYATQEPSGSTLAQLVHQGFTPLRAVDALLGLCRLLDTYHEAGLVHGDIKPSLVHLDGDGKVRLGSFGLVGLNSANRKRLQSAAATRQVFYLDPEQARSGDCNVLSDGYSIGCIFVQLLTGRPPYIGNSYEEVLKAHQDSPVPTIAAAMRLPTMVDEIIAGWLAKIPFQRYDDLKPAIRDLGLLREMLA